MFTGIIECTGTIEAAARTAAGVRLALRAARALPHLQIGESIAVDGVCLTVVVHDGAFRFEVDVGPETLARTTLGRRGEGDRVNLERALRVGDRLGGHMVSGHVDGVGAIEGIAADGDARFYRFVAPDEVRRYLVAKGSVCVDGVSLTVSRVTEPGFEVMLIPHTLSETTLGDRRVGDPVNLEADLIGKYVERLVAPHAPSAPGPRST